MNKYKETFGVDISKDVFDVHGSESGHIRFTNSPEGFKLFLKSLPAESLVVMEATGYYNDVPLYNEINESRSECRQLLSLKANYLKRRTSTKNKLHGEKVLGVPSKLVVRSLKLDKKHIDRELAKIEQKLLLLVKESSQRELTLLKSIPGIGDNTAVFLIVATDSFNKFNNASQLCSYLGTTPTIKRSGSSVRGRSRISKMGSRNLRNLMFMCSMSAYKYNRSCKDIHDRIVNKGKSSKLALMAVCNKLIHQAFAIVKSGIPYDPHYVSVRKSN